MNNPKLEENIQLVSKFCFNDPFGKGRIRNLMYEYDCMLKRKNEEIERLRTIVDNQAITIDFFADKCMADKKKYEELEEAFDKLFKQTYSVEREES